MEEQHPIPQQISSYQFRLVGDMTLKQFFQVAGGALVSLLIYSSGLPGYIKWPLIVFSFLLGVALAFLPIQDRPLSIWIISFFKSIYAPTIYTWKKDQTKKEYFQPETPLPQVSTPSSQPVLTTTPTAVAKPTEQPLPITPSEIKPVTETPSPFQTGAVKPSDPQSAKQTTDKKDVFVPTASPIAVEHTEKPTEEKPATDTPVNETESLITPAAGQKVVGAKQAEFSPGAAPPIPPTKANIVVGQVVGPNAELVENAILEIKDSEGRSVRALRSNKLGHFMIVTPLVNGRYEIITEKDGFEFEPVYVEMNDTIIPPIAIKAKSGGNTAQNQPVSANSNIYQS